MQHRRIALAAVLNLILAGGASSADTYLLDPVHTWVGFSVRHMVLAIRLFARGLSTVSSNTSANCPVTTPNGKTPPGEHPDPNYHGNGALWTVLSWPEGKIVFRPGGPGFVLPDGSLSIKWGWWRGVRGNLTIDGGRLDAHAPPLRARIPAGYGDMGFQATALIFPTEGCWEVTGKVGKASLTFVTLVVKVEERK